MSIYKYIAWTSPGLQNALKNELKTLNIKAYPSIIKTLPSTAVEFSTSIKEIFNVMHYSRTITHLNIALNKKLWARSERELQNNIQRQPIHAYIPLNADIMIRCHCMKSKLMHTKRWEQALNKGLLINQNQRLITHERKLLLDYVEQKKELEIPEQKEKEKIIMHVYIYKNKAQVMFALHDESLHKQGFRKMIGQTPLPENVASALVNVINNSETDLLWDPFCGSGSIILSVIQQYMKIPIRVNSNSFQLFKSMPIFPHQDYEQFLRDLKTNQHQHLPFKLLGTDKDPNQLKYFYINLHHLERQIQNLERTQPLNLLHSKSFVSGQVQTMEAEFSKLLKSVTKLNPGKITILSNLPWNIKSKINNFEEIIHVIESNKHIEQAYLLISDQQWRSLRSQAWEVAEEILVGGKWAKLITKKQLTELTLQSTELQTTTELSKIVEPSGRSIQKMRDHLKTLKEKLTDVNLDERLKQKALAKVDVVKIKDGKRTKSTQITARKRQEFIAHEKFNLIKQTEKLQQAIYKNEREENIESFKRKQISENLPLGNLSPEQTKIIQQKLDKAAQEKAKSILQKEKIIKIAKW